MAIKMEIQHKAEVRQIRQRQETYLMRKKQEEFEQKMNNKYKKLKEKIEALEAK